MTMLIAGCLLVLLACLLPCFYLLLFGPTAMDRLLAFDLVGVLVAVALAPFSILQESWVYLEISMGLAVLALVGTVAVAHYLARERERIL